jgi:hypothetical protein
MINLISVEKESNPTRLDFLPNQIPSPDFTRKANYDAFPKDNSNSFLFENKLNNDSNEIKPEDISFQKGRIDTKESTKTMFDFALQKRFKDSLPDSLQKDYFPEKIKRNFTNICFLPFFHLMDQNITPSLFEIRHIILSDKLINENTSVSSGEISITPANNVSCQAETKKFIQKKRRKKRGPRKDNSDNMRVKIKRGFCRYSRKKLNKILKKSGSRKYFDFFPSKFSSEINKKNCKLIVNMTLKEIFLDKNLYIKEDEDGLCKYRHNLKVVKSEEVNEKLQEILDKTFRQLYEDYINSDNFKVDEINRLKKNNEEDNYYYIEKYKITAKNLINFFSL